MPRFFPAYYGNPAAMGGASFVGPLDFLSSTRLGNWSCTHRLFASYTGNLCRLRSSASGNPTQDIAPTALGVLDETAVATFKGSDNIFWHTVYDQGTIGINFQQTSISAQPAYSTAQFSGKPSMLFDGTNDGMISNGNFPAASIWWGYAVVRKTATGSNPELWAVTSYPDTNTGYRLLEASGSTMTFNNSGGTTVDGTWANNTNYSYLIKGTSSSSYIKSSAGGTGSSAIPCDIIGGKPSTIGYRNDASAYLTGHIIEWGYFSGTLSSGDEALLWANLNSRFGTPIP